MSDLLEAASAALGTPAALIQRSAAARAAANGTTIDAILGAWAGGVTVAAPVAEPEPAAIIATETAPEEAAPVTETAVAVLESPPTAPVVEIQSAPIEAEPLEPAPLGERLRTATRVGGWTGAALGIIGFLGATAFWAPTTGAQPEGGPVVQVDPTNVMIGIALVSVVFGAIVASMTRAAVSWRNPAMQLSGPKSRTAWIGAAIGLVLGVAAAGLLTSGFGTPIEDSEQGLVQLPVLATLAVMLGGGAILGALTAVVPQLFGTPVAVEEADAEEVATVRRRLGDAVSVPVAGLVLLAVLVLPFALALIESNHLVSNGAAIIAIITAAGILGFATLAGSKPNVRISFGELMVAVIGIGTVILILLVVFVFRAGHA